MAAEAQILTILNIPVALHLSRVLYKSTLFMQNKPNFRKAEMNITPVKTMNYEQRTMNYFMQNKPNFRNTEMNTNYYITKTYENNLCSGLLENKPNQSQSTGYSNERNFC